MSELTLCNFCSLERMKQEAKERGTKIVVETETHGEMRGWTSARYLDQDDPSAWFMQLTAHCNC